VKSLPAELTAEFANDKVFIKHLITITVGADVYHWTDSGNNIYYGGFWYGKKEIEFDPAAFSLSSKIDNVNLKISNVDKGFSNLALSTDLRGSEISIERALLDYKSLDPIGAPVLLFLGYIDTIYIDRKKANISVYNHLIKWKTMTPRREHSPLCPWVFKGENCRFDGKIRINGSGDNTAEWTRSHGSLNYKNIDDDETDLTRGGTYSGDSYSGAGYESDKAFDDDTATYWQSTNTALPHWLKIQFSSDQCSGGTATADGYNGGFGPEKAFDNDIVTSWEYGASYPHWIKYDFGAGNQKVIISYWFRIYNHSDYYSRMPKTWTFEGSNNDIDWTTLDTQTNQIFTAGGVYKYSFTNATAYRYYRLNISAGGTSGIIRIGEMQMKGIDSAAKIINRYSIKPVTGGKDPRDWKLEGSNDDSAWTILDEKKWISWASGETKSFCIPNKTAYAYYKLTINFNSSGNQSAIYEFDLFGPKDQYNDDDYNYTNSTLQRTDIFTVSCPDIASDSTSILVKVKGRVKQSVASARTLKGILRVGSTNYESSEITPGTTFGSFSFEWSQNPATSAAWTVAQIKSDLVGFGYRTPVDAGGNRIDVSESFLSIEFLNNSCDKSIDRCILLGNRVNFGGFTYIPMMAQKEIWWGEKQKIWQAKI